MRPSKYCKDKTSKIEPTFCSDMLRTDSMVGIFSDTRATVLRDPIWFEGTKAEAEEAIIATTARTIGENLVILMVVWIG